ncbi:hypothetical protein NFI96_027544, partial [Prochilodus magdalenae]
RQVVILQVPPLTLTTLWRVGDISHMTDSLAIEQPNWQQAVLDLQKNVDLVTGSFYKCHKFTGSSQKFKIHGTVANLPGHCGRRKTDDKSKRRIIRMATKEPRKTSKEIKGELQAQGRSVSDRTIRRCLSQSGFNGRRPRRTPLLKTKHKKARLEFAKLHGLTSHKASGRMSYGQMRQK